MLRPRYLASLSTDVWLHDGSPGTPRNDASRDVVGGSRESTRDALEASLRQSIGLIDVSTGQTCTTGIHGIDQDDGDTGQPGLVLDAEPHWPNPQLLWRALWRLDELQRSVTPNLTDTEHRERRLRGAGVARRWKLRNPGSRHRDAPAQPFRRVTGGLLRQSAEAEDAPRT
jgi:hypothetical protein